MNFPYSQQQRFTTDFGIGLSSASLIASLATPRALFLEQHRSQYYNCAMVVGKGGKGTDVAPRWLTPSETI
jgi:hypothetical protein